MASTFCPQLRRGFFRNGSVEQKSAYFNPREWENQERLEPEAYYQGLQEVFARKPHSLLQRQSADRDVAHGGAGHPDDLGLAKKRQPGSLPCYTFGSMFRGKSRCPHSAALGEGLQPTV